MTNNKTKGSHGTACIIELFVVVAADNRWVCSTRSRDIAETAAARSGGTIAVLRIDPRRPNTRAMARHWAAMTVVDRRGSTGLAGIDAILSHGSEPTGFVVGSAIMLFGDPGIGKTTLLTQIAGHLGRQCLYVTAEKNTFKSRAAHIGVKVTNAVPADIGPDIMDAMKQRHIKVVIIDSIQSAAYGFDDSLWSVAKRLMVEASRNRQTIVMSHDENLSGKTEIEHTFDVVMRMKMKRRYQDTRSKIEVSCIKNRFGSVGLATFFDMTGKGLVRT